MPCCVADQIDAGDVDAHAVGRDDARGLAVEVLTGGDQPARDDAVAQDLLLAVDVVEVHLQRLHPLRDARLEARPLGRGDHPRHQVERERTFLARQRERDALVDEGAAERVGARFELGGVRRGELGEDALVGPADVALRVEHLVEGLGVAAQIVVAVEDPVVACGAAAELVRDGRAVSGGNVRRLTLDMLPHTTRFGRPVASASCHFGLLPAALVT